MDIQHLTIKLYCVAPATKTDFALGQVIPVFHRWIQEAALGADELLIDIADYAHVPAGPGVLLIGHDAFYSLEYGAEKRLGLLYQRRTKLDILNEQRVAAAVKAVLKAQKLLENEAAFGAEKQKLQFIRNEMRLGINDKLLAPNTPATFTTYKADLAAGLVRGLQLQSQQFTLEYVQDDPRRVFQVKAQAV